MLSYLDFFATGVQRVALATAANMCRQLPADAEEMVVDCVPILTNLLTYQDTKVRVRLGDRGALRLPLKPGCKQQQR